MTAAVSELLTWFGGGAALATLSKVLIAVCAAVFGLVYRRYLGILGADRRRPAERQAYDALRDSLSGGNLAARLSGAVQSGAGVLNPKACGNNVRSAMPGIVEEAINGIKEAG
jgi:hypothetical protein